MFCPTCGKEYDSSVKFCPYCGTAKPVQPDPARQNTNRDPAPHTDPGRDRPPVQPNYPNQPVYPQQPAGNDGYAIGALVCGILSIILSMSIIFGIVLAIVAIVLSNVSARHIGPTTCAKAGKICGIIGLLISIAVIVLVIVLIVIIGTSPDLFVDGMEDAMEGLDYLSYETI